MVGIGLFAPLPLAIMIPFMAGQSFAMGEAFGKGFQFGKRKISSMSNEDFNKLTAQEAFAETTADIKSMIPTMSNAMNNFHTLQTDIILRMIDYIAKLPADVGPQLLESLTTPIANPNALFKWVDVFNGIKSLFGSDAQTLKFLQDNGFTAAAVNANPLPSSEFERLRFLAIRLNSGTVDRNINPPAPPKSQQQLFNENNNYSTYRQKGGLLSETQFNRAKGIQPELLERQRPTNETINEIVRNQPTIKRRAGQSVKLQRDKLIRLIAQHAKNIREAKGRLTGGTPNSRRLAAITITNNLKTLQSLQVALAKLLTIYQF